MSDNQICPWCNTEIVWDEEIGPEETCPHCSNELSRFRSVKLQVESSRKHRQKADAENAKLRGNNEHVHRHNPASGLDEEDSNAYDELAGLNDLLDEISLEDQELLDFEEKTRQYIEVQDEVPECPSCQEFMVFAGVQKVDSGQFNPFIPSGLEAPFISAPFTLKIHICPACFQVSASLSEEDQLKVMASLGQ